jgi:hypothetical protein
MSTTSYRTPKAIPLPLAERPTGEAALYPRGQPTVKPFEKLAGPAKELVLSGGETVSTASLTPQPLTRTELEREQKCLAREAAAIARRQRQIEDELLSLPTAA